MFSFFLDQRGYPNQLARTSTNPMGPKVKYHVSL
jgi:hypothetical protein